MRVSSRPDVMSSVPDTDISGVGLGLRSNHYHYIESRKPAVRWFEILVDNYLNKGGSALSHLQQIRQDYAFTFHGVGLSLGSTDPLNKGYMRALKDLIKRFQPQRVSDHLAWVSVNQRYVHDLIPLPYTNDALTHFCQRVSEVQDFLGIQLLIENPSSYLNYKLSDISETDFLKAVVDKTGCALLLDVNNIYVSASNNNFSAERYLDEIPIAVVKEIHLAGYEQQDKFLLDTHGQRVHVPVWELYSKALARFGPVPTLIEWDTDIPEFDVLAEEAAIAQRLMDHTCRVPKQPLSTRRDPR